MAAGKGGTTGYFQTDLHWQFGRKASRPTNIKNVYDFETNTCRKFYSSYCLTSNCLQPMKCSSGTVILENSHLTFKGKRKIADVASSQCWVCLISIPLCTSYKGHKTMCSHTLPQSVCECICTSIVM